MLTIEGQHNTAYIMVDNVEESVVTQLYDLLNCPAAEDMSNIVIMPDCHSGKGCVIGFTAQIKDKIIPNLVGVDIGCGVAAVDLTRLDIRIDDFESFDQHLRNRVPYGFDVFDDDRENKRNLPTKDRDTFVQLASKVGQQGGKCIESLGTLGGGEVIASVLFNRSSS